MVPASYRYFFELFFLPLFALDEGETIFIYLLLKSYTNGTARQLCKSKNLERYAKALSATELTDSLSGSPDCPARIYFKTN
jgi:hypothetical protein